MKAFLKGMGSVLNIFGQGDYDRVVPKRSVEDKMARRWKKLGINMSNAMRVVVARDPRLEAMKIEIVKVKGRKVTPHRMDEIAGIEIAKGKGRVKQVLIEAKVGDDV